MVDVNTRYRNRPAVFERQTFFGQLQHILVVNLGPVPSATPPLLSAKTLLLAAIKPCIEERPPGRSRQATTTSGNVTRGITYYKRLGALDLVDIRTIQCVVGRVQDRGYFGIIERVGTVSTTLYVDED